MLFDPLKMLYLRSAKKRSTFNQTFLVYSVLRFFFPGVYIGLKKTIISLPTPLLNGLIKLAFYTSSVERQNV